MSLQSKIMLEVFEKNKYTLEQSVDKSKKWFKQQVSLLDKEGITPNRLMNSDQLALRSKIRPGSLYVFFYDPKLKETLPYYDRFPMVFPYKTVQGGFLGLNMHYLPYQMRIQLLDRLMDFASNTRLDSTTKLNYSWQLIAGVARYKAAQPCIKHYLAGHVRSQFRKIEPYDWTTALLMPVERFVGATKDKVWKDSWGKM